jgi:hypothetical protein
MGVDSQRKEAADFSMLVWRISENTPLGEWVEAHTIPGDLPHHEGLPEVSLGSWAESSFDLLHGTDVSESHDTVPDDLLDELFSPPGGIPKPAGR